MSSAIKQAKNTLFSQNIQKKQKTAEKFFHTSSPSRLAFSASIWYGKEKIQKGEFR